MEDVDLHDALTHDVEEELGVMTTLLRSDHVVHHDRTQKLNIVRKLQGRDRRDRARSISQRNEGAFPL